jgi:carbon-monoxide dehydrogenase small subunit
MRYRAVLEPPPRVRPSAKAAVRVTLTFTVNGRSRRVRVPPMKRLLDVLRQDCGLPGTKEGCGEGECGACSVLINGRTVCACLVPAVQADGTRVVTVEGLARGPKLSALQQAFLELGGAQCGICTPGMLITSMELLGRCGGRVPSEDEVREALAGNLCRCTGYQKIVDAVRHAAGAARRTGPRPIRKTRATSERKTVARANRKIKAKAAARARRGRS